MIKLRITLESKQDIIREIEINDTWNLEKLSKAIIDLLNLEKLEMASFFLSDSDLNIGQEIPLFNLSENETKDPIMNDIKISSVLYCKEKCLIYVHDFLNMWRFHIEFIEKLNIPERKNIKCTYSIGMMPKKAPELKFESNTFE